MGWVISEVDARWESPSERKAAAIAHTEAAAEVASVWVGRVKRHFQDAVIVDVGAKKDKFVVLARIQPIRGCALSVDTREEYRKALVTAVPVGSTVTVVRSRERNGDFRERYDNHGFVHPMRGAGTTPDPNATSVNETFVTSGIAEPDPEVPDEPGARGRKIEEVRASFSPEDFSYWAQFVRQAEVTKAAPSGLAGRCAAKERADMEAQRRAGEEHRRKEDEDRRRRLEREREERAAEEAANPGITERRRQEAAFTEAAEHWAKGPDGLLGTADDYTGELPNPSDYGISVGSGGGRSCDGDGDGVCYE